MVHVILLSLIGSRWAGQEYRHRAGMSKPDPFSRREHPVSPSGSRIRSAPFPLFAGKMPAGPGSASFAALRFRSRRTRIQFSAVGSHRLAHRIPRIRWFPLFGGKMPAGPGQRKLRCLRFRSNPTAAR